MQKYVFSLKQANKLITIWSFGRISLGHLAQFRLVVWLNYSLGTKCTFVWQPQIVYYFLYVSVRYDVCPPVGHFFIRVTIPVCLYEE